MFSYGAYDMTLNVKQTLDLGGYPIVRRFGKLLFYYIFYLNLKDG